MTKSAVRPSPAGTKRKASGLSAADVELLFFLEGCAWPSAAALAKLTGVSTGSAARRLDRLLQSGACGPATVLLRDPSQPCQSITYLRVRMIERAAPLALDARLAGDPHIDAAVRLSGSYDYRIEARHRGIDAAGAWFRDLLTDPAVAHGHLRISRTVFSARSGPWREPPSR